MALAVAIFLLALALIASERLHRTKIALAGAALVVLFVPDFNQELAIESVDFNTIGLLVGMMILVVLTQQTGVYDYIAIRAGQLSRGRPLYVVLSLATTTALLSAFLDNLTTILLVVPITFLLADALDIDPIPLIIIEVMASNIGGTATLIGDPPNIIIAGATGLTFNEFIVNLAPIALLTFVIVTALLYLFYRSRLQIEPENRRYVMELDARRSIDDPEELRRTGPILIATILLFFAHQALHIEPATVALAGASARSARDQDQPGRGPVEDRVADSVLLRGPVRDGRGARGDGRHRRGRHRRRGPDGRRSHGRAARHHLDRSGRLGGGGQHPLHHGDDPGG